MIRRRNLVVSAPLWPAVFFVSMTRAQDTASPAVISPLRVLFVGSSLIYINSLPTILRALSLQPIDGRRIEVEDVTFPDWTLARHWDSGKALGLIRSEHWDFVVLHPLHARDLKDKPTALFDTEIRRVGAKTIIFANGRRFEADNSTIRTSTSLIGSPLSLHWVR